MTNKKITRIKARTGKNNDTIDIMIDVPVSTVDTTGLPTPPVVAVDANRVTLDVPDIIAAVPPPAIIARVHVISGLKSTIVDNITMVPAKAANATAMLSNKLSMKGIKYATISTSVATPKMMTAERLPSHCQDSLISRTLK